MTTRIRAGLATTVLNLANVAIGLMVQALLAAELGISSLSDDFQLGWAIVTFGALIFFSMVSSYFVPRMHPIPSMPIPIGGVWIPIGLGALLTCIQLTWAAFVVHSRDLSEILLWSSPAAILASLAAIAQVIALLERRYIIASLGAVANGLGFLGFLLFVSHPLGAASLGQGLSLGYITQLLAVGLPLILGRILLTREVSIRLIPFLGVAGFTVVAKLQPVVERLVSISVYEGSATALGIGQRVAQGLLLVSAFGLTFTSIATVTKHVNADDSRQAGVAIAETLASTMLFCSVVIAFSTGLIRPAIILMFERGSFTADDTLYVTNVVYLQIPWVFASAVSGVLTSYLYVSRRYFRVIWASFIGILATVFVSVVLAPGTPQFAAVIASSCASVLSLAWLCYVVLRSDISPYLLQALSALKPMTNAVFWLLSCSIFATVFVRALSLQPQWLEAACCLGVATTISLWFAVRKDVREAVARVLTAHV